MNLSPSDLLRAEQILVLAIVAAMNQAQIGEACPFGDVVISFKNGKPISVKIERTHKPDSIQPPVEVKAA